MSLYGILSCSATAMLVQSHALERIGSNVSNIQTVGYKANDTLFKTQLYHYISEDKEYYTAGAIDRRYVSLQGSLTSTSSSSDLAINGDGFFLVRERFGTPDTTMLTRAGNFGTSNIDPNGKTVDPNKAFLVTAAGDYVLGWQYDMTTNSYAETISPLDVTPVQQVDGTMSTTVGVDANIPASGSSATNIGLNVYDAGYNSHTVTMNLVKASDANEWTLSFSLEDGVTTTAPVNIFFNGDGDILPEYATQSLDITWADGTSQTLTIDLSELTQLGDEQAIKEISTDGKPIGTLRTTSWSEDGVLNAIYTNNKTYPVAKLAIGTVTVPDSLQAISNNLFGLTQNSGPLKILDLTEPEVGMYTSILSNTLEASNVVLEQEFTKMITTQRAYSSASTVFTTGNEMFQTATNILS
ncbi:MAG: flagellar hook-basal body complex protein [Alphaproteobacteria bacterium]|nr:flagellar hook-basal body complex protein [Alphaproteobacteria bacterium]